MAPFHQCPWENCTYTREEVPIGNVSSPEDNFKLCESKDMTDSSIFPSPSQEGCSDVLSIPETGTSTAEDTSMKATSTTASSQSQSEKKKKPNILCIPDNSRHAWKYFNKKGQICDLCANVLPKFVLRCIKCNIQVCMICASRKGWILSQLKMTPSNLRRWDPAH